MSSTQALYRVARAFLAEEEKEVPYVIGIAGSVAAGKSTVARVLRALISRWPGRPDVLIVEGLNMLEAGLPEPSEGHRIFVSDYCDFSIYVDAEERYIKEWYLERFLRLREEALEDSTAYFHRFADLTAEQARDVALRVWDEIDHPNLKKNIEPTKQVSGFAWKRPP